MSFLALHFGLKMLFKFKCISHVCGHLLSDFWKLLQAMNFVFVFNSSLALHCEKILQKINISKGIVYPSGFIFFSLFFCFEGVLRWQQSCPRGGVSFVTSVFGCLLSDGLGRPQMETNHSSNPEAVTELKATFFQPPADTSCSPDNVLVRGQIQHCSFVPSHRFPSSLCSLTWCLAPGWFGLVSFCCSNQYQNDANVDFGTYNSIPPPWYPVRSSE